MLELRPASEGDRPFLDGLFVRADRDPSCALGYPRCPGVEEYLAELALYGRTLTDATLVAWEDHRRVGAAGFLWEGDHDRATLVGPLVVPSKAELGPLIEAVEEAGSARFTELVASVAVSNERLTRVLEERGWELGPLEVELVRALGPEDRVLPPADVHEISPSDRRFRDAVRLVRREFDWDGDAQGFQLLVHERDDHVAGAAMWGMMPGDPPYARFEYLVVDPRMRRRGVGKTIVRDVLFRAAVGGALRIFLAVDPEREAARRLYARFGFSESVWRRRFLRTLERPAFPRP